MPSGPEQLRRIGATSHSNGLLTVTASHQRGHSEHQHSLECDVARLKAGDAVDRPRNNTEKVCKCQMLSVISGGEFASVPSLTVVQTPTQTQAHSVTLYCTVTAGTGNNGNRISRRCASQAREAASAFGKVHFASAQRSLCKTKVLVLCCAGRSRVRFRPLGRPLGLEPARSAQSLCGFSSGARLPPNERTENTGAAFSSSDLKRFKEAKRTALHGEKKKLNQQKNRWRVPINKHQECFGFFSN